MEQDDFTCTQLEKKGSEPKPKEITAKKKLNYYINDIDQK